VSWRPDATIEWERFADYWNPALPYFDKMTHINTADAQVRVASILTDEIDYAWAPALASLSLIESGDNVDLHTLTGNGYLDVKINHEVEPFNDVRVRQALSMGVNREELIDRGSFGMGSPAH